MTNPSFIAIVDFTTEAADRPTAIAHLERELPVVSAMPGCLGFRIFASRGSDTGITVLHEWTDSLSFDEYLASEAFARAGSSLRPMMIGATVSRRFRVELVDTVV